MEIIKKSQFIYTCIVSLLIVAGLISRFYGDYFPGWVVEYVGDILWAGMVYFGMRLLVPSSSMPKAAMAALLFSYFIEFSQLYQAEWIRYVRSIPFMGLILGHGFLWSDILCYTVGVGIAFCLDRWGKTLLPDSLFSR